MAKQTKLTEQQLSIILSMKDKLMRGGCWDFGLDRRQVQGRGCLTQMAFNEPSPWVPPKGLREQVAKQMQDWFDKNYRRAMTPDELLAALEERGWA